MTHKEESYALDTLIEIQDFIRSPTFKQLVKETHENNIMLRQIIRVINTHNARHQHIDIHDNFIFGIGSAAREGYRGAIAFANANNNINYVYIHDNIIKNFVKGFQFVADKLFWVKNNVLIDVVTKQGENDYGIFTDNIEITTS